MTFFFVFFAFLALAHLGFSEEREEPKHGGSLRFGLSRDISPLNPFQRTLSSNKDVRSLLFEPLLATDGREEIKPYLALSWDISSDGLTYTFRLRPGVRFHGGQEMTAEDVRWSAEHAMHPQNRAYGHARMSYAKSVQSVDPLTVRFVLKEPMAAFLAYLTGIETFPIVPKGSVPSAGERVDRFPPGTGPFEFVEWKPASHILLKRFPSYWQRGIPYLDEIVIKPVPDHQVRFASLRSGDLDMVERIPYDQVERIRKGVIKNLGVAFSHASGFRNFGFNTQRPPFDDVRVRQAVAYAIDKKKLIDAISWGLGTVTNQKLTQESRWYVDVRDRPRDQEKARALLASAGIPKGFRFKGSAPQGREDIMQIAQADLREVGLEMEIEILEFGTHMTRLATADFLFGSFGGDTGIDPDIVYFPYFHSEPPGEKRINNFVGYRNPKLDALLEDGRRVLDFKRRYAIYKNVVEILQEEVPEIFYGFNPYVFAFSSRVKGFTPNKEGQFYYGSGGLPMVWLERK
jgi:ABC-type transport system substrate-binding protein